jgi:hypothetical protein
MGYMKKIRKFRRVISTVITFALVVGYFGNSNYTTNYRNVSAANWGDSISLQNLTTAEVIRDLTFMGNNDTVNINFAFTSGHEVQFRLIGPNWTSATQRSSSGIINFTFAIPNNAQTGVYRLGIRSGNWTVPSVQGIWNYIPGGSVIRSATFRLGDTYIDGFASQLSAEMNSVMTFGQATNALEAQFGIKFQYGSFCGNFVGLNTHAPHIHPYLGDVCNTNPLPGGCGVATQCNVSAGHHRSAGRLMNNVPSSSGANHSVNLVGHALCYFYENEHITVRGIGGRSTMNNLRLRNTLSTSWGIAPLNRIIQHEISHNLGAASPNAHCDSARCAMGVNRVINRWCDDCSRVIWNHRRR